MKKNYYIYVIITLLSATLLIPSVRKFFKEKFLPLQEINNEVTLSNSDLDIQLKGINTPSLHLKNLSKDKLVFLNFWGTWCPPCVEEWASIQKLYEKQNKKVNFVLIAMLDEEEKVKEFIKKNNYTAPVYIAENPLSERLLPKVFPSTYLLDSQGRILKKETSAKNWDTSEINTFIEHISTSKN